MLSLHDSFERATQLLKQKDQKSRFLARQLLFLHNPLSRLVELYLYNNEGQPQKLDKFPMMRAIYDGVPRKLLLKCSRKTLKSTLISNIIALNLIRYNYYKMMYIAPNEQATKRFSHDYLSARFQSPPLKDILSKLSKNDVYVKEVEDSHSNIILTYASEDANRTRGPATDHNVFDEVQGMNLDILPIINETMAISQVKREVYAGTPLTTDNTISCLWKKAHQIEWITKCSGCNHWNMLTEANEPLKMILKAGLSCSKCSKLLDTSAGQWVDMNPGDREIYGFHMAQPILPYYNQTERGWKEIYNKVHNIDSSYSVLQVYNEVFGLPYDVGTKPITEEHLKSLCVLGDIRTVYGRNMSRYVYTAMGVDWGVNPESSRTVCTILGFRPDGIIEVFYIKIFKNVDYEQQIREIADLARAFNCNVFADSGPDPLRAKMLGNLYEPSRTQLISYRETNLTQYTDIPANALDWSQTRWCLNRSETMSFTMDLLKKNRILFPAWDSGDTAEAMQDILNIFIEVKEDNLRSKVFYRHRDTDPDDFYHTLNYAACSAHLWAGNSFFTTHNISSMDDN
jgi:hypothetical protein